VDSATLEVLEFNEVLSALAGFVLTGRGKELIYAIGPAMDMDFIEESYREFTEANSLFEASGRLSLAGTRDIRAILTRPFPEGAFLLAEELLQLKDNLIVTKSLRAMIGPAFLKQYPALAPLFSGLSENTLLRERLLKTIDDKGLILDSASPRLRSIRNKLRSSKTRIRNILSKLIQDPNSKEAIQDDIITIRDDRFVLSVVAGKSSEIPGVIHGRSGSGATFFVEPMELVDLNNSLSILKKQERSEERAILREITALVLEVKDGLLNDLELIAALDVLEAKVLFARKVDAVVPEVSSGGDISFLRARHPLLALKEAEGQGAVVPVDITVQRDTRVVVISGANTGGKTVALKTLGLLTLMAASGLPLTTGADSRARIFSSVFADVGDRQDIGASLSTFSAHVRRLTLFLREAGANSLVLIDEIGAGTDPAEAEALGLAVLERLKERGALSVVTTHLNLIKAHGAVDPGYENVSVEFDEATLKPRYTLIYGVPGPSLGINIAGALGLAPELIERARGYLTGGEGAFVESIRVIEKEKERLRKMGERLELMEKRRADELRRLREQRDELVKGAKERINSIVEEARAEVASIRETFTREKKKDAPAAASISKAGRKLTARLTPKRAPVKTRAPFEGEKVSIKGSRTKGVVTRVDAEAGRAELLMGSVKVWVDMKRLELSGAKHRGVKKSYAHVEMKRQGGGASGRLNLIGLQCEEAIGELTRFIDNAHLEGLEVVEVIHGMGTGALKKAVAEYLRSRREVKSFCPGPPASGGAGVTVVYLK